MSTHSAAGGHKPKTRSQRPNRGGYSTHGAVLLLVLACGGKTVPASGDDDTRESTSSRSGTATTSRSTTAGSSVTSSPTSTVGFTSATTAGPAGIGLTQVGMTSAATSFGDATTGWSATGGTGGDFSGTGGTPTGQGGSSNQGEGGAAGAAGYDFGELCQADCENMALAECEDFSFDYCMDICTYYAPSDPACEDAYAQWLECDIQADPSSAYCVYGVTVVPDECYDEFNASLCD